MTRSQAGTRDPKHRVGLEGLDAYRVSLAMYRLLVAALRGKARSHVTRQATKAAESVVLNIAEAHPATGADRARRFRIAANEASECSAALDLLEIRGTLSDHHLRQLRQLLDRQRAMLWRLSPPAVDPDGTRRGQRSLGSSLAFMLCHFLEQERKGCWADVVLLLGADDPRCVRGVCPRRRRRASDVDHRADVARWGPALGVGSED